MSFLRQARHLFLGVLLFALPMQRVNALLNLEGNRTQLYVFGDVTFAYSSNIFSDSTNRGDSSITGEVGAELKRRAGIIAISSVAKFDYQRFFHYTGENAFNPNLLVELSKTTGRLTGSLSVNFYRESRSDSAINLRTNSWNFPVNLTLKYPLNEKFYATSDTGYLNRRYQDNPALVNYTDYSEAVDLFYVYTSKLDLVGGYRFRWSETTGGRDTFDHWFNFGATGNILAKLNGTLRVGYQIRKIDGGERFNHVNAVAALTWPVTRKLTVSSQIGRDFNTIATGASVDSTSITLRANYSFTRKADVDSGVTYGRNLFLGGVGAGRRDDFFSWDISGHYKINDHLRLAAGYTYLQNWSTLDFSDFDRQGFTFDIASRF